MISRANLTRVGCHTEQTTDHARNTAKLKARFTFVAVVDLFA